MKTEIKALAEMYALGAISAEQIKEESNCSNAEYKEALQYAKKYSHAYDEYLCWMKELNDNPARKIVVLNTSRVTIYLNKNENRFHCIEMIYIPGNIYRDPDVDIIGYTLNSVEAFKLLRPELYEYEEKHKDIELPF